MLQFFATWVHKEFTFQNSLFGYYWLCMYALLAARPLTSDTCRVMRNVTQYLNYFFSMITAGLKTPPECLLSTSCNDIDCTLSNGGYYNLSILPCQSPPALKLVTSGHFSFQHTTIASRSETVPFLPLPGINLNITFTKIDHFFFGLAVSQCSK